MFRYAFERETACWPSNRLHNNLANYHTDLVLRLELQHKLIGHEGAAQPPARPLGLLALFCYIDKSSFSVYTFQQSLLLCILCHLHKMTSSDMAVLGFHSGFGWCRSSFVSLCSHQCFHQFCIKTTSSRLQLLLIQHLFCPHFGLSA